MSEGERLLLHVAETASDMGPHSADRFINLGTGRQIMLCVQAEDGLRVTWWVRLISGQTMHPISGCHCEHVLMVIAETARILKSEGIML